MVGSPDLKDAVLIKSVAEIQAAEGTSGERAQLNHPTEVLTDVCLGTTCGADVYFTYLKFLLIKKIPTIRLRCAVNSLTQLPCFQSAAISVTKQKQEIRNALTSDSHATFNT